MTMIKTYGLPLLLALLAAFAAIWLANNVAMIGKLVAKAA